jgi:integrase
MQKGYIYQANGAWHVRYRVDGEQISRKLADYNDQYRTKRSVRPLAGEIIDPLNQGREVDGPMTLQQYAETVYFPNIKPQKSPSTLQGQFQPVLQADSAAYRWTQTFDVFDFRHPTHLVPHRRTRGTSHQSFLNINSVLSAIFTHARRSGTLQGPNPTDGVETPEGKRTEKTHQYTLGEVEKITDAVDGAAGCAVVVAAWTSLSLAELRGLKWEDIDFDRNQLSVVRTVWHREIIETKTQHRAATVHLLPNVVAELKRHRKANPMTAWVFEDPRVFPLELATLGSKVIKKVLQGTGVEWRGFHAFRRGLATRLYNNRTPIETVGKILRHGSGSEVTLKHCVEVEEKTNAAALQNLPMKSKKTK